MDAFPHRFLFALTALAASLAAKAAPQFAYNAVALMPDKSVAVGISNSGDIAGNIYYANRGFLYSQKGLEAIDADGSGSIANAVNNSGQVAGGAGNRAFVYSNGTITYLGFLDDSLQYATAYAINDAGYVAGVSNKDGSSHAFVYHDGVMQDLGTLPGGFGGYAYAINNRGQIAGQAFNASRRPRAVMFEDGVVKDLGTLGGLSYARGINDRGHVVGASDTVQGDSHAFLYANGVMHDLGAPVPGNSFGEGINNLDQVVGTFGDGLGRAFFYDEPGGMRDLNAMVDPASGWFIHQAHSINDRQQIVGLGCKNGEYGAVLLVPTHMAGAQAAAPGSDSSNPPPAPASAANPPCPWGYP